MKSLIVLAISLAAATPALACSVFDASGVYAGQISGDVVANKSGRPVGTIQGDVVSNEYGSQVGRVNTTTIQNNYGQNVGFVQGSAIFNLYGEQRGQGINCSQQEKGAALLLLLAFQ